MLMNFVLEYKTFEAARTSTSQLIGMKQVEINILYSNSRQVFSEKTKYDEWTPGALL